MNELFLSQDIRNLNPRLPDDGEPHLVRLTNVSSEGVISLQIDGPGLTSLGEVFIFNLYRSLGDIELSVLCTWQTIKSSMKKGIVEILICKKPTLTADEGAARSLRSEQCPSLRLHSGPTARSNLLL